MEEEKSKNQEQAGNNKPERDNKGRILPGNSGNLNGRPPDTPEQKIVKKAIKEFVAEYKQKLAEALPLISPVLIKKAQRGDLGSIKEINDRVMGKPPQDITSGGEKISIPIYGGESTLPEHNGDQKDIQPPQKDKSGVGGDVGQQDDIDPDMDDRLRAKLEERNPDSGWGISPAP